MSCHQKDATIAELQALLPVVDAAQDLVDAKEAMLVEKDSQIEQVANECLSMQRHVRRALNILTGHPADA